MATIRAEEVETRLAGRGSLLESTDSRQRRERAAKSRVKASRRLLLETYMQTHDMRATANRCGVSVALVRQVLAAAIYRARRLAGLWPPGAGR